jgi:hypothetical protein
MRTTTLFPSTRVEYYPEKLQANHLEIEAQIDKIKTMIEDKVDDINVEWKNYCEMIEPRMDEKNATTPPLLRAYHANGKCNPSSFVW